MVIFVISDSKSIWNDTLFPVFRKFSFNGHFPDFGRPYWIEDINGKSWFAYLQSHRLKNMIYQFEDKFTKNEDVRRPKSPIWKQAFFVIFPSVQVDTCLTSFESCQHLSRAVLSHVAVVRCSLLGFIIPEDLDSRNKISDSPRTVLCLRTMTVFRKMTSRQICLMATVEQETDI